MWAILFHKFSSGIELKQFFFLISLSEKIDNHHIMVLAGNGFLIIIHQTHKPGTRELMKTYPSLIIKTLHVTGKTILCIVLLSFYFITCNRGNFKLFATDMTCDFIHSLDWLIVICEERGGTSLIILVIWLS